MEKGKEKSPSRAIDAHDDSQPAERMDLFSSGATETGFKSSATSQPANKQNLTIYSGQNRFISVLSKKRVVPIAIVSLLVLTSGLIFTLTRSGQFGQSNTSLTEPESQTLSDEVLSGLPQVMSESTQSASGVTINGPLRINNTLVVAPVERPAEAQAGQIYFDATTRSFVFFDGSDFQTISTAQETEGLRGFVDDRFLQNAAEIGNQIQAGINIAVGGLLEDIEEGITLEAGNAIKIEDQKIINIGVTSLQGTANQIIVTQTTGDITISLPQDIGTTSSPEFAGITLGTLSVSGTATINALNLDQALGISSGGTGSNGNNYAVNGLFYYDGDRFVTVAAENPSMCLVSTLEAPQFAQCGDVIADSAVTRLNNLTGALTIANADASVSTITIHTATEDQAGLVNTGGQTFGGLKTFSSGIRLATNQTILGESHLTLQPAAGSNLVVTTSDGGNIRFSSYNCSSSGNGGKLTVNASGEVICAADTGGDGVGIVAISATDASIEIDVTDGDHPKLSVNLQGGGGLSTTANGLGLLDTCLNNQVLKFDESSREWQCADDTDTTDGDCSKCVALQTTTPGTPQTGHMNITGTIIAGESSIGGNSQVSGQMLVSGTSLIRTLVDDGYAFSVQSTIGNELMNANTKDMTVTIGSIQLPYLPDEASSVVEIITGSNSNSKPHSIALHGKYMYVALSDNDSIGIYDIADPMNPRHIKDFHSGTYYSGFPISVVAHDDWLFISNGSFLRVAMFDISDRENPDPLGFYNTGTGGPSMEVRGNYMYHANDVGLHTFQIEPDIPEDGYLNRIHAANPGFAYEPTDLALKDGYVYLTDEQNNRLIVFSLADPTAPAYVTHTSTHNTPRSIKISGDYAYIANEEAGTMQIFDISNPNDPTELGSTNVTPGPRAIDVYGNHAFVVGEDEDELQIIDIKDPTDPYDVGAIEVGTNPNDIKVDKAYAYVANRGDRSVHIIKLTKQALTINGDSIHNGNITAWSGNFSGNIIAMDGSFGGDITARDGDFSGDVTAKSVEAEDGVFAPSIDATGAESLSIGENNATGINLHQSTTISSGKTLFVQGNTTIQHDSTSVFSVKNTLAQTLFDVNTRHMSINIGVAGAGGTEIFEVPESATDTETTGSNPYDLKVVGNYAYVTTLLAEFEVYDVSDPENITQTGTTNLGAGLSNYVASNGSVAVANLTNTVKVLDVSNPASPTVLSTITPSLSGTINNVAINDNYAFVFFRRSINPRQSYIEAYDISNPSSPSLAKTTALTDRVDAMYVDIDNDYAYVAIAPQAGFATTYLHAIDISDPSAPGDFPVQSLALNGTNGGQAPRAIAAKGNYIYVAFSDTARVRVFDFSNKAAAPTIRGTITVPVFTRDLDVSSVSPHLFLTEELSQTLHAIDISDPDNPDSLGSVVATSNPSGFLRMLDTKGSFVFTISQGSAELSSFDFTPISSKIALQQDTVVSEGAKFTSHGATTIKLEDAAAFVVQNAGGANILHVDTQAGIVYVASLNVSGLATIDTLTVETAATFNGSITVIGHIVTSGDAPSTSVGASAGDDASCSIDGNDTSGTVTIEAGTNTAAGVVCTITFDEEFDSAPRPVITSTNDLGVAAGAYVESTSTTAFTIAFVNAPEENETYAFNYINLQ